MFDLVDKMAYMQKLHERQKQFVFDVVLFTTLSVAVFLPANCALGESLQPAPRIGDEYEISRSYETSGEGSSGGSSRGRDAFVERVIGVRDGGLELEFDLPNGTTPDDRARSWQFPVRVFRPPNGPMQLLNRSELEARVDAWLKTAGWTREDCGRWIFTWSAFRVECDPQTVVDAVEGSIYGL